MANLVNLPDGSAVIAAKEKIMVHPVFLTAAWRSLVMLNFEVEPRLLGPFVPRGTELDLWHGRALVSLVGFRFLNTRLFGWRIPGHGDFSEVNLRFYVRREMPDGCRRGVVFLKEVAPHVAVAFVAKRFYNENYVTMPVTNSIVPPTEAEIGHGRYCWGRGGSISMAVTASGVPQPPPLGSEAAFIVEHYWGYTRQRDGSTLEYQVEHRPWSVWHTVSTSLIGDTGQLYGDSFGSALHRSPCSAFLVDGSDVTIRRGVRVDVPAPKLNAMQPPKMRRLSFAPRM